MSISSSKKYNMGFHNPYSIIMYQYVEDDNQLVSIDVLVPCVHMHCRFICPSIQHSSGMFLILRYPNSFVRPIVSLLQTKKRVDSTRTPTKQQPSSKLQRRSKRIPTPLRRKKFWASGAPQCFKLLPFKVVEPDYYTGDGGKGWEVQIFDNEDMNLYDKLDGEVISFFVLSVNLVSVEKPAT
jgi:hypothetical protein